MADFYPPNWNGSAYPSPTNGTNNEGLTFTYDMKAGIEMAYTDESEALEEFVLTVEPTNGNTYLTVIQGAIGAEDYDESAAAPSNGSVFTGNAHIQSMAYGQNAVSSIPAVCIVAFGKAFLQTAKAREGIMISAGVAVARALREKMCIRIATAFTKLKASPGNILQGQTVDNVNTLGTATLDGRPAIVQCGALELLLPSQTGGTPTPGFTANTVQQLALNVQQQARNARWRGTPVLILDNSNSTLSGTSSYYRALNELTGGASTNTFNRSQDLSNAGNAALMTGVIPNFYDVTIVGTSFLQPAARAINGGNAPATGTNCVVGAYLERDGEGIVNVVNGEMELDEDRLPYGGLQRSWTGWLYCGAGVGDFRRAGAVNIQTALNP